jgi:hypothetical protein
MSSGSLEQNMDRRGEHQGQGHAGPASTKTRLMDEMDWTREVGYTTLAHPVEIAQIKLCGFMPKNTLKYVKLVVLITLKV